MIATSGPGHFKPSGRGPQSTTEAHPGGPIPSTQGEAEGCCFRPRSRGCPLAGPAAGASAAAFFWHVVLQLGEREATRQGLPGDVRRHRGPQCSGGEQRPTGLRCRTALLEAVRHEASVRLPQGAEVSTQRQGAVAARRAAVQDLQPRPQSGPLLQHARSAVGPLPSGPPWPSAKGPAPRQRRQLDVQADGSVGASPSTSRRVAQHREPRAEHPLEDAGVRPPAGAPGLPSGRRRPMLLGRPLAQAYGLAHQRRLAGGGGPAALPRPAAAPAAPTAPRVRAPSPRRAAWYGPRRWRRPIRLACARP